MSETLNLALRWIHVFAAILWIGQTYLFTWLDRRFETAEEEDPKQVWMVHSGGFYVVEKRSRPDFARRLNWFRWEAALTWLSGLGLLIVVYYAGGLMVDPGSELTSPRAIALGIALLPIGWIVYDLLWSSPLGRNEAVGATISFALIVALAFVLTHLLSSRAAYMHVGAVLGTLMAANVWVRILPAQRQMIAATREGRTPDASLAARAKGRSKHNTFMVIPVVFIMLSSHFPVSTYGHRFNWAILGGLTLVGWVAARIMRRH
ncbi:MAG TPA: urate hydroxylase PuuD [Thermoanaerobaculia bacterium]|nr:urate hydroxylase PuuD [Thermoanaerobaculia bacterium]